MVVIIKNRNIERLVEEINENEKKGAKLLGDINHYMEDTKLYSLNGNLKEFTPENIFYATMRLEEDF